MYSSKNIFKFKITAITKLRTLAFKVLKHFARPAIKVFAENNRLLF